MPLNVKLNIDAKIVKFFQTTGNHLIYYNCRSQWGTFVRLSVFWTLKIIQMFLEGFIVCKDLHVSSYLIPQTSLSDQWGKYNYCLYKTKEETDLRGTEDLPRVVQVVIDGAQNSIQDFNVQFSLLFSMSRGQLV